MPIEEVLCVSTELLHICGHFQGFMPLCSNYTPLFLEANQEFRPRDVVEDDPLIKQLIPYIIVERGGRLLNYYRGSGSGESRLRGNHSIGIGGHINPCDLTEAALGRMANRPEILSDMYVRGLLRELNEELRFKPRQEVWDIRLLGLINEDETSVGRVHLGAVHVLHTQVECVAREEDVLELDWNTHSALLTAMQEEDPEADNAFELWSRICLEHVPTLRRSPAKRLRSPHRVPREKN